MTNCGGCFTIEQNSQPSSVNFQAKSGSASASVSLLDTMMMVSFFVVLVGIVGLLADSLLLVNVLSVLCVAGLLIILALGGRNSVPKR